ncbi:MAG: phenylalanine--tRNA ligase beta subunit [Chitinophagales bacterium]|nr:MAG: phenylalanine--tRNA ligase beta subunit [Chitinophagales bacterium]
MKISYNWLKEYLNLELSPYETAELLTDIGLETEAVTEYKNPHHGWDGLVIGAVKKVSRHPNADKLHIALVDIGQTENLQIVCGAPNIASGQKVVVALPGTTIYPSKGQPVTIRKATIRGTESSGMICAEDEIGLGTSHDGILVLPDNAPAGAPLSTLFTVHTDYVFDIGLTPNRADAFSHIGVARDLRAAINIRQDKNLQLLLPEINENLFTSHSHPIEVIVENPTLCPRYAGVVIQNLRVGPSPQWLQQRLLAVGQRPINNIVDITNYILLELGQPLHAFDAAKIKGRKIIVKTLPQKTPFTTLDGNQHELNAEDLMICDAEEGLCIAGVFGGLGSGVTEQTTTIFLESAYFLPSSVRKTSTRHNLRTEAAMRFEKGVNPDNVVYALKRAASLMVELAGGEVASAIVDIYPKKIEPFAVTLRFNHLDRLAGYTIDADTIKDILEQLDIRIEKETQETLQLQVPPFKPDVQREADIAEEILRIYGFNRIPIPETFHTALSHADVTDAREHVNHVICDYLSAAGFHEIINNSLSQSEYYANQEDVVRLLKSTNTSLNILRKNMVFSGLETIRFNLYRHNNDLKLFELGKSYHFKEGSYSEKTHLALFLTGNNHPESWKEKSKPTDFFYLKSVVHNLLQRGGITTTDEQPADPKLFDFGLTYFANQQPLVSFGLLQKKLTASMDIRQEVYHADFDWELFFHLAQQHVIRFREIPRFPGIRRDLALLLAEDIPFKAVRKIALEEGRRLLKDVNLFDLYRDPKWGNQKKSYAVSYFFMDENKTLTDKDIDEIMERMIQRYRAELQAEIR